MAACTCADPKLVAQAINDQDKHIVAKLEEIHKTLYGSATTPDPHSGGSSIYAVTAVSDAASDAIDSIIGGSPSDSAEEAIKNIENAKAQASCAGQPGLTAPVRFAHWLAPEVSGESQSKWNNAFRVAQLAIATANALVQGQIADKNQDLAKAYYDMAKEKWDRFESNYMPLEKELLKEVSSVEVRSMQCADDCSRANTSVSTSYGMVSKFVKQQARKYRICIDPSMSSMLDFRQSSMLVDSSNYNISDDRWFTDYKNDQRWNRRSNVLNLGRNLTSLALSYGDMARSIAKQVGTQVNDAASSLMQSLGYYGGRNDTVYPTTFMGSHGNMGHMLVSSTVNPVTMGGDGLGG